MPVNVTNDPYRNQILILETVLLLNTWELLRQAKLKTDYSPTTYIPFLHYRLIKNKKILRI